MLDFSDCTRTGISKLISRCALKLQHLLPLFDAPPPSKPWEFYMILSPFIYISVTKLLYLFPATLTIYPPHGQDKTPSVNSCVNPFDISGFRAPGFFYSFVGICRYFSHFVLWLLKCIFQVSLESRVTHRYLADSVKGTESPLTCNIFGFCDILSCFF